MKSEASKTPRLSVRMACGVYEGLLLFGVLACAGLLYGVLLRPDGSENWGPWFSGFMLVVMAGYFTWFWSKGETLAMATWHLRIHCKGRDQPPSKPRALLRFALSLLWFLPGLTTVHLFGLDHVRGAWWTALGANILVYAALTRLHPSRQYLHDLLAGTEMLRVQRVSQKKAK
ncbi:MAG: RDD family protein [Burkholderiales bacterium]